MLVVQVWWASLRSAHAGLLDVLDATERSRVAMMDRPADRARSLLGAALLRCAAGAALGAAPEDVEVRRACAGCGGPHGQPRVAGGPHLSLSHSGVLVVAASCWSAPVGIDVQRVDDVVEGCARDWAGREALVKAGLAGPGATVVDLVPPLPGYASVLAVPAGDEPSVSVVNADAGGLVGPGRPLGAEVRVAQDPPWVRQRAVSAPEPMRISLKAPAVVDVTGTAAPHVGVPSGQA